MKKVSGIVLLLLLLFPLYTEGLVTIKNKSFEETKGDIPLAWEPWFYEAIDGISEIRTVTTHPFQDKRCVLIHNKQLTDARLIHRVTLPAHTSFAFSCWIKTENVSTEGVGAVLSLMDYITTSNFLSGTHEKWQKRTLYIETGDQSKDVTLCLCLGGYSAGSSGKAYFDGVNLAVVKKIPRGQPVVKLTHIPTYEQQVMEDAKRQKEERALIIENEQKRKALLSVIIISVLILGAGALIGLGIFFKRKHIIRIKEWLYTLNLSWIKTFFHTIRNIILKIDFKKIKDFILTYKYFLLLFILTFVFTIVMTLPKVLNNMPLSADVYRDITYAQNVLNGNCIFDDPTIKGEFIWYPPLNALLMAGLAFITPASVFDVYNYSQLFINAFIPLLFFLLLSVIYDKRYAFVSVLLIPLMPWLSTHVFQGPMPSVHSFAFVLLTLYIYIVCEKKGMTIKRSIFVGATLGMCLLMHSLSGLIVYGTVGLCVLSHMLFLKQKYKLIPFLIMALLPILLWSPYVVPNIIRPKLNPVPMIYFANVLFSPDWTLLIPNKHLALLFWLFIMTGLILFIKRSGEKGYILILCGIVISLAGQGFGYVHHWAATTPGVPEIFTHIPTLITHEFQWYTQLFILPLGGLGFLYLLEKCINKKYFWVYIILITAFLIPGYKEFIKENEPWMPGKHSYDPPEYIHWVRENTDKNAVFLIDNDDMSYFEFGAFTARKIVYHKSGYMNFNVDVEKRSGDRNQMLRSATREEFLTLAAKYEVEYAILHKGIIGQKRADFFRDNFPVVYDKHGFFIIKI